MHRNGEAINGPLSFVLELYREELVSAAQQHKRGDSQIYFVYLDQWGGGRWGGGVEGKKGYSSLGLGAKAGHMCPAACVCVRVS